MIHSQAGNGKQYCVRPKVSNDFPPFLLVAHLVSNDKDRLKVVAFIDGATVSGLAHACHPCKTYHTFITSVVVFQV